MALVIGGLGSSLGGLAGGMLLGPAASGWLFERHGGGPMLEHLAVMWGTFVVFCFLFRKDDPAADLVASVRRRVLAESGADAIAGGG